MQPHDEPAPSLELAEHAAIVGLPVGYRALAAAHVVVASGLIWALRRLALKPLEPPGAELPTPQTGLQATSRSNTVWVGAPIGLAREAQWT